jgi:APA family basic amino acid/polyamine antiporter
MALYLGLNLVYALALPASEIRSLTARGGDSAVEPIAQLAAHRLFGPSWADALTIGVGLILVATLSALLLTGPRVLFAMAKDGQFPTIAARTTPRAGTPGVASAILAGWGILLLWSGSFDAVLLYSGIGLGDHVHALGRVGDRPSRANAGTRRPFRVPGYPWTPAFFVAVNLGLIAAVIATEPRIAALSILSIAAGYPVYLATVRLAQAEPR